MAQAKVIKGGSVRVYLGNNANPTIYTAPCGLTSRSITLNKALSEEKIPDCDDPDSVAWLGRGATSRAMEISGEGVLAQQSMQTWLDALDSTDSVPVKIEITFPKFTVTWEGKMQVDSFQITANDTEHVKASISMKNDGEMIRTIKAEDANNNGGN